MPNISEGGVDHGDEYVRYRPSGPEDDVEGPWFYMSADQIRKLAAFVGEERKTVRVEYRGAGWWAAESVGSEGELTGDRVSIPAV